MKLTPRFPILLVSLGIWLVSSADTTVPIRAQTSQANCTAISERDASVLLYLIPQAFDTRLKGNDVVPVRELASEGEKPGKYVFRLEAVPHNPSGSSLVGYFLVDKCTGEVTDDVLGIVISSDILRGIQKSWHKRTADDESDEPRSGGRTFVTERQFCGCSVPWFSGQGFFSGCPRLHQTQNPSQ